MVRESKQHLVALPDDVRGHAQWFTPKAIIIPNSPPACGCIVSYHSTTRVRGRISKAPTTAAVSLPIYLATYLHLVRQPRFMLALYTDDLHHGLITNTNSYTPSVDLGYSYPNRGLLTSRSGEGFEAVCQLKPPLLKLLITQWHWIL